MSNSSYDDYMLAVTTIPLLTLDEEIMLGHKVQAMIQLKANLKTQPNTTEKRVLRLGARARTRMVEANLRLVVLIANKFRTPVIDIMDQIQLGNLGLILAVEKFDPTRGYKFSTFAFWWIRQSITRGFEQKKVIRIPEHTHHKQAEVARLMASKSIGFLEACAKAKINPDLIRNAIRAECLSLDYTINADEDSNTSLIDLISGEHLDPYAQMEEQEDLDYLENIIMQLSNKENFIVSKRLQGVTFKEIGAKIGLAPCTTATQYQQIIHKLQVAHSMQQTSLDIYEQAC